MEVERPRYLKQLIDKKDNGRVKIITGVRRCGKSYLLFELYRKYLLSIGINGNQIIMIALDSLKNAQYRNPIELDDFLREKIRDNVLRYYIFIDEIQFVEEISNPYLKNSNSKMSFVDLVLGLCRSCIRPYENLQCRCIYYREQFQDAFIRCVNTISRSWR